MLKSPAYIAGFIVGILIVAIVTLAIGKILKKNNKQTNYDERQQAIRGKSFKAGFIAFFASELILILSYSIIDYEALDTSVIMFLQYVVLYIGALAFVIHAIWHDAYFHVGEKKMCWTFIMLAVLGLNVCLAVFLNTEPRQPGTVPFTWNNLAVAILLFIIICNIWLKALVDKKIASKETDGEDD